LTALQNGSVLVDLRRVYDELERLPERYGIDPEHPEAADRAAELDAQSMASWLDGLHLAREARFLVDQANTSLYNSELADLSMLFVVQQTAASAGARADQSETMRIANGNASLPRAIAAELGAALIVDAPVTSVRRDGDLVEVTARGVAHFGAHVVLATPPRPMRAMQFDPPLPPAIADAIAGLDLGGATKVVNQYHRPFWTDSGESGFSLSDLTYRISWDAADSYDAPGGLLTTLHDREQRARARGAARRGSHRTRAARAGPSVSGEPEQLAGPAVTMAWSEEPFTGGGYAVYKPQQLSAFWEPLRAGHRPHPLCGRAPRIALRLHGERRAQRHPRRRACRAAARSTRRRRPGLHPVGRGPTFDRGHQWERGRAVDHLAHDVGMPRVARGFGDHVQQDPAHRPRVDIIGGTTALRAGPEPAGRVGDRPRWRRRSLARPRRRDARRRRASRWARAGSSPRSRPGASSLGRSRCRAMSIHPRSVVATCLMRPPTLSGRQLGVAARLLVGEPVGGDPDDVALLGEIGEQSVSFVGDWAYLSGHGCLSAADR
jgi:hypothetical protein